MNGTKQTYTQTVHRKNILQKVRTKKNSVNKKLMENTNKAIMYVLTSFALLFFTFTILFIVYRGMNSFSEVDGLKWLYFMKGNYYATDNNFFPGLLMMFNSIWTTFLVLLLAIPISVMTSLFITRIAPKPFRAILFSLVALLAAVPSVIYGAFGSQFINSFVYNWTGATGPLLSVIFTLTMMVIPTITLITVTSINNVDKKMEMSSLALGATRAQTTQKVTMKAITTGILTGAILGIGRAMGEASAVSMVAGETNWLPSIGVFENIRLITSTMLKGWWEIQNTSEEGYTFSLAMVLMITVLVVFFIMKFIRNYFDPKTIEKKEQKKTIKRREVEKAYKNGLDKSDIEIHKRWFAMSLEKRRNKLLRNKLRSYAVYYKIMSDTTVKPNISKEKRRKSLAFSFTSLAFSMIGILLLLGIISFLLIDGTNYLSWDFISTDNKFANDASGLRVPILGTFLTLVTAFVFTIPIGLFAGIYFGEYSKGGKVSNTLLAGIELLSSIPSLIMGLIGFILFVPIANAIRFAPLSGGLILTFIVIPTVVKTTEESIKEVNKERKEGSFALGATKSTTVWKVAVPQAMPGVVSGLVLAAGRMLGESAAIIMIWGPFSVNKLDVWIEGGGTTLATEIYRLTGDLPVIPWDAVKAIGIVIISIILLLTILSNSIKDQKKERTGVLFVSILLMLLGIGITNLLVFLIGISIALVAVIWSILLNINDQLSKKGINIISIKIQYKLKTWRAGK